MTGADTLSARRRERSGRRPGRPRLVPRIARRSWMEPREEILDVAAGLFVDRGFAGTSTREIAEAAGIRQASLYHYFAGKEGILAELLQRSIRPTLTKIEKVEALAAETGAGLDVLLHLLVVLDVRTLARAPRNAGVLTRLPEVERKAAFDTFRDARDELRAAYVRIGGQVLALGRVGVNYVPEGVLLGKQLIEQVEVVIGMRSEGHPITPSIESIVAATCLRICLADQTRIDEAAEWAADLIAAFEA